MKNNTLAVAAEFLRIAKEQGEELSPLKLQKLVYYVHGWHLALLSEPLLTEAIEAWPYGPIVPTLYHRFKKFGKKTINEIPSDQIYEEKSKKVIRAVWNFYSRFTAKQLSEASHEPSGPWQVTIYKKEVQITNTLIEKHFKAKANITQTAA